MIPQFTVFDNLAYRVNGGTVTLFGQVRDAIVKDSAEARVKHLEGVELGTYTLGPIIFLLIVLGIARMFGKAKTRRSRAFIAFVFLVIVFMSHLSGLSRLSERQQSSSAPVGAEVSAVRAA